VRLSFCRGFLFFEIIRVLKAHQPMAFLLENVPGLLEIDEGATFQRIIKELEAAGYRVHHKVVNSKWKVPQNRERLYFAGFRNNLTVEPFTWPDDSEQSLMRIRDILEPMEVVGDKFSLSPHQWDKVEPGPNGVDLNFYQFHIYLSILYFLSIYSWFVDFCFSIELSNWKRVFRSQKSAIIAINGKSTLPRFVSLCQYYFLNTLLNKYVQMCKPRLHQLTRQTKPLNARCTSLARLKTILMNSWTQFPKRSLRTTRLVL
jgi:hypothetical protein